MPAKKRILSVSYDESLLTTRHLMLEGLGFEVSSAYGFAKAVEFCRKQDFDLVIMGHSIPHYDKKDIVYELRQKCDAPVLALHKAGEAPLEQAEHNMEFAHPEQLLGFVKALLADRSVAKRA